MAITMQYMKSPRIRMSQVKVLAESTTQHCYSVKVSTQTKTLIFKQSYNPASLSACQMAPYKACMAISSLARRWREVQGLYDWENLTEPLDPLLQQEIIRYGKFVAACYSAFDLNPNSQRYLNCKYGRKVILKEVGMGDSGYEVNKYIYVTPDINFPMQNGPTCGRWIGYIAVSRDDEVNNLGRRDLLVTFRGTITHTEWIANLMSSLTSACLDPQNPRHDVMVETGFLSLYTSNESETRFGLGICREQLLSELSLLICKYKNEELSITIAGHSMGSSLALLLAYDLSELGLNKNDLKVVPITVFSFAGPRVGNLRFKERCEKLGIKVLRVVNPKDPITMLPGVLFNENFRNIGGEYEVPWRRSCYVHVGVELVLDLFKMEHIFSVHDFETYINLLKCARRSQEHERKGVDMCIKAKELMLKLIYVKMSPCRDAAIKIVNKVTDSLDKKLKAKFFNYTFWIGHNIKKKIDSGVDIVSIKIELVMKIN